MGIKLYNTRGRLVDIDNDKELPRLLAQGFVRAQPGAKPYNPLLDRGLSTQGQFISQPDPRHKKLNQVKIIGEVLEADLID